VLEGRQVFIAYDSDVMTKDLVQLALTALTTHLAMRGAVVRWIILPPGESDLFDVPGKQGLDDFLAAGHVPEDLLALVELPRLAVLATGDPYEQMQRAIAGLHVRNDPPFLYRRADALVEAPAEGDVSRGGAQAVDAVVVETSAVGEGDEGRSGSRPAGPGDPQQHVGRLG
jgi:hypothetical protein